MKKMAFLLAATAMALPGVASAAAYNFNVIYSGNDVAALAPGSDDPLSVVLGTGDTFAYRLTAAGAGEWTTLASGSIFPFFALNGNFNQTGISYVLNLNQNGGNVFNFSESTNVCCAHLGTNTISFGAGLVYDEYELLGTIGSTGNTDPAASLLPWPGQGPENYSPGLISFSAGSAVPEPATWAMLLAGFGMIGYAMRRREKVRVSFV